MFDRQTKSDPIFSESIKKAEDKGIKVILAANNQIEKEIANQNFRLIKPSSAITNGTEIKLGLVGTASDNDGFIRRYISADTTITDNYQKKYYSLGIEAVSSFMNIEPKINSKGIKIGDFFIPHYNNQNTF